MEKLEEITLYRFRVRTADGREAFSKIDGRTVRFQVEHRSGEEWKPQGTLEAKVENGIAQAQLQVQHPSPDKQDAELADLRFSCELL